VDQPVDLADVSAAARRIAGQVVRTPFERSLTLSEVAGVDVAVKFENLQFTGSFKERGALNRLLALTPDEAASGVVAMSAGNHAQGVAYHAHRLGIAATIVMPEGTPFTKVSRTRAHGARVELSGDTVYEAAERAAALAREEGSTFVHPYDDPYVIAGQGTVALEILDADPGIDCIAVPVGGGGLLSGVAVAVRALRPSARVVGVQCEGFGNFARAFHGEDFQVGATAPATIADGIAVKQPGELARRLATELVDEVVTVTEAGIERAICLYLEVEKTVAEGAGAASLAAVLEHPDLFRGRRTAMVISGGNIDPRVLSSVALRGLMRQGRLSRVRITMRDLPGQLGATTAALARLGANVVDVTHDRLSAELSSRLAAVDFLIETLDVHHAESVVAELRAAGFDVAVV